ncbi:uncharacterized protein LOC123517298 [Portunus trituberculatus]|uniref:uncharacterized protein LOC123517298 n=1 Tax=Portunus trituberculatus TaxID=210409 RepID=UPI001E1CBEE8|nr:uncharacterized protein LOC123517298 [Portunus trituberculatus]
MVSLYQEVLPIIYRRYISRRPPLRLLLPLDIQRMKRLVLGAFLGLLCLGQAREDTDGRFVAARSTKTAIFLTTSTTTSPFTCVFATNGVVCQRRRRRYSAIDNVKMMGKGSVLEGSLLEVEDRTKRDVPEPAEPEREARIAFTLWTTTTSTYTITSTSINSSTTFSLSFYCTVNGANDPPACG